MQFKGYRRPDGKVGIRNHVLILPSVVCANRAARGISLAVAGTTWVEHQHGCTQLGADAELTARVLVAHGTHPNVTGVIVVGLGCETIRAQDIAAEIKRQCPYKNVATIIIQDEGGSVKAIAAGAGFAREFVGEASAMEREWIDAAELILGTECGGSDACSGISANPALGVTSDMLIDAGGSVILAETTEIIGAEHLIAARAVTPQVARKCFDVINACEASANKMGVDMRGGQPAVAGCDRLCGAGCAKGTGLDGYAGAGYRTTDGHGGRRLPSGGVHYRSRNLLRFADRADDQSIDQYGAV